MAPRNLVSQSVGMLVTIGIGYVLDLTMPVQVQGANIMIELTSAILSLGGLVGILEILCYRGVGDPHADLPTQPISLFVMMRHPLGDKNFLRYLAINVTFILATGFIGQYLWL